MEPVKSPENGVAGAAPERAEFVDRAVAALIDNVLLLPISFFLVPLYKNAYWLAIGIELAVIMTYFAVFAYFYKGQTVGKRFKKLKVVTSEGKDLTLPHFLFRELVARGTTIIGSILVGMYANVWLLTYILAATDDKRTLHDRIAGTQVIQLK